MATFAHTFTVEGMTIFPLDMLRYNQCFPASSSDVGELARCVVYRGTRMPVRITLRTINTKRRWAPEVGRWESFGWKVLDCYASTL